MDVYKKTVFNLDWLSHADWFWLARCAGDIHSLAMVASLQQQKKQKLVELKTEAAAVDSKIASIVGDSPPYNTFKLHYLYASGHLCK